MNQKREDRLYSSIRNLSIILIDELHSKSVIPDEEIVKAEHEDLRAGIKRILFDQGRDAEDSFISDIIVGEGVSESIAMSAWHIVTSSPHLLYFIFNLDKKRHEDTHVYADIVKIMAPAAIDSASMVVCADFIAEKCDTELANMLIGRTCSPYILSRLSDIFLRPEAPDADVTLFVSMAEYIDEGFDVTPFYGRTTKHMLVDSGTDQWTRS